MSNAALSPEAAPGRTSWSASATRAASTAGGTTTRFDSSSHCSTNGSGAMRKSFGAAASDEANQEARPRDLPSADMPSRVARIVERIALASEAAAAHALLVEGAQVLGAESALFTTFCRLHGGGAPSCRVMAVCDPIWLHRYLEAACFAHDPWIAYAASRSQPTIASSLKVVDATELNLLEVAAMAGFASVALIPAHSGGGSSRASLLCLGHSTPRHFETLPFHPIGACARMLALELHDWWLARLGRELMTRSRLTSADLVLLEHQALGHSSKRIAAELQISHCSVNSRFQRMNSRLGVANRRRAAQLAADCGLLSR